MPWARWGAEIYSTDVHGSIVVITDGEKYSLQLENVASPIAPPAGLPMSSSESEEEEDEPEVPQFTLDIVIVPSGVGTVKFDPEGETYPRGTVVHLTAKAEAGYQFVQWIVDGVPVPLPEVYVTMDSDKTVSLNFKRSNW